MRRALAAVAILAALAAPAGCAELVDELLAPGAATPAPGQPHAPEDPAAPPAADAVPAPPDAIAMEVVSITDGDTLRLLLAEEPNELVDATWPIAVRLIGIDTPEVHPELECYGEEAEAELARLAPVGSIVLVAPDEDSWDDYDRRLFYLWNEEDELVNLTLVAGGSAEAIRVAPNDAHYELLLEAERAAQAAGLGMWGACVGR